MRRSGHILTTNHHIIASQRGFTLIELLVALAITAVIAVASSSLLTGVIRHLDTLEGRQGELYSMMHLRRLLGKDMRSCNVWKTQEYEDAVIRLSCDGKVIPDYRMGPRVELLYRIEERKDGTVFERLARPIGNDEERELTPIQTMKMVQGLRSISYELLGSDGEWHSPGEDFGSRLMAVHWDFQWERIGQWRFFYSADHMESS